MQYISDIVRDVKKRTNNRAPVIVFCKGANLSIVEIAGTGCDVVGLDWTIDIADVKSLIGNEVALQGNLDPTLLYASEEVITDRVNEIAQKMGDCTGHIFNLGHGITPEVDPDRARAFVNAAKSAYKTR